MVRMNKTVTAAKTQTRAIPVVKGKVVTSVRRGAAAPSPRRMDTVKKLTKASLGWRSR